MSGSNLYEENNYFKPCLTKQLLNVFKLWCELASLGVKGLISE